MRLIKRFNKRHDTQKMIRQDTGCKENTEFHIPSLDLKIETEIPTLIPKTIFSIGAP